MKKPIDPNRLRLHVLDMVYRKKSGHIGGSFSIAELVAALYTHCNLTEEGGDRLVLSKGHAVPIIYAALFELGLIDSLDGFREINSPLQGHPFAPGMKNIHATTGSLGQGLSIAMGQAMAMLEDGGKGKVYCILGDGECSEGQVSEAAQLMSRLWLPNLVCIVDVNGYQSDGEAWYDCLDVADLFSSSRCIRVGYNEDISKHIITTKVMPHYDYSAQTVLIMKTQKAAGVSFMEGTNWHARIPTEAEYIAARHELEEKIAARQNS